MKTVLVMLLWVAVLAGGGYAEVVEVPGDPEVTAELDQYGRYWVTAPGGLIVVQARLEDGVLEAAAVNRDDWDEARSFVKRPDGSVILIGASHVYAEDAPADIDFDEGNAPHHERGKRGAKFLDPDHQEDGLRLPQPRELQNGDLLPLWRIGSLSCDPRKSLKDRKASRNKVPLRKAGATAYWMKFGMDVLDLDSGSSPLPLQRSQRTTPEPSHRGHGSAVSVVPPQTWHLISPAPSQRLQGVTSAIELSLLLPGHAIDGPGPSSVAGRPDLEKRLLEGQLGPKWAPGAGSVVPGGVA